MLNLVRRIVGLGLLFATYPLAVISDDMGIYPYEAVLVTELFIFNLGIFCFEWGCYGGFTPYLRKEAIRVLLFGCYLYLWVVISLSSMGFLPDIRQPLGLVCLSVSSLLLFHQLLLVNRRSPVSRCEYPVDRMSIEQNRWFYFAAHLYWGMVTLVLSVMIALGGMYGLVSLGFTIKPPAYIEEQFHGKNFKFFVSPLLNFVVTGIIAGIDYVSLEDIYFRKGRKRQIA